MKKIFVKIIIMIIILTCCNIFPYSYVRASETGTLDDIMNSGKNFIEDGNQNTIKKNDLQSLSKFVSGVLLTIAAGVTIITGAIMGISFFTQSIEDKAKIKESMTPWIIGIIVSFGAYTIWSITVNIFQSI